MSGCGTLPSAAKYITLFFLSCKWASVWHSALISWLIATIRQSGLSCCCCCCRMWHLLVASDRIAPPAIMPHLISQQELRRYKSPGIVWESCYHPTHSIRLQIKTLLIRRRGRGFFCHWLQSSDQWDLFPFGAARIEHNLLRSRCLVAEKRRV